MQELRPPQKTVVDQQSDSMGKEPAPVKVVAPHKHGRKAATLADDGGSQPPSKWTKKGKAIMTYLEPRLRDMLYKPDTPVSRDPLPDHPGCNVCPAEKQPKWCTTEEVAAEREAKQRAIEEKIRELEDVKQRLAEMNASEDIQDDEMNEENPQCLSAAVCKCAHVELEGNNDDKEVFDFGEVDPMADSSDIEEPVKPKVNEKSNVEKLKTYWNGFGNEKERWQGT